MSGELIETKKIYNVTISRNDGRGNVIHPNIEFKSTEPDLVEKEVRLNKCGWAIFDPVGGSRVIVRQSAIVDVSILIKDEEEKAHPSYLSGRLG